MEIVYSPLNLTEETLRLIDELEDCRKDSPLEFSVSEEERNSLIYNSVAIEGNSLRHEDVTEFLRKNVTIREAPLEDYIQVKNQQIMLEHLKVLVCDPQIHLSEDLIKMIHKILTYGEIPESGIYRDGCVHIRGTSHIPPTEEDIPVLMRQLVYDYNSPSINNQKTQFEKICDFKRNFERIHPFFDGNGRTGRLIMNLLLLQNGYPYINFPVNERLEYFASLENNTFVDYAARKCIETLHKIKERYNGTFIDR